MYISIYPLYPIGYGLNREEIIMIKEKVKLVIIRLKEQWHRDWSNEK